MGFERFERGTRTRSTTRRLNFDVNHGPIPKAGDVLYPAWPRGRAWYLVKAVEPVESPIHDNRWKLTVQRIDPGRRGPRSLGFIPTGYHGPELTFAEAAIRADTGAV